MPRTRLTDRQIIEALEATCGQVYLAAERLGCRPETIVRRMQQSQEVAAVPQAFRGRLVDTAEAALYRAILDGESWAIRFTLSTLGHQRGYGDRPELAPGAGRSSLQSEESVTVQDVLQVLIGNDEYVDYCRAKRRAHFENDASPPAVDVRALPDDTAGDSGPAERPSDPARTTDPADAGQPAEKDEL